jgi:hypothetical protein
MINLESAEIWRPARNIQQNYSQLDAGMRKTDIFDDPAQGIENAQWSADYNALTFGIAGMGSATIFFWLQLPNITKNYRTALNITEISCDR